ncbi:MAG: peptidylprolyl isomerase [Gammaproteobacteria bacterium]|jgi:cyclophilin family peptidyl-prolyl cis-trans isomerase
MTNGKLPLHRFTFFLFVVGFTALVTGNTLYAEDTEPRVADERIVFSTNHGDLVFALYPDIAPEHVSQLLKLTENGVFDYSTVMRVIPDFIIQFSDTYRRLRSLTKQQADLIKNIKGEFSNTIKHTKGRLTMARYDDDPDSATTSFSILLGDAPHLDGKYTVFGHLESGGTVVNSILSIPLQGEKLSSRVIVNRAFVVHDIAAYYESNPKDPVDVMGTVTPVQLGESANSPPDPRNNPEQANMTKLFAILLVTIILVSLFGVLLQQHIAKNRLISLLLVNVLVAGFGLIILFTPYTQNSTWLGIVLFVAIFGLFRLMSRFEKSS